MSTPFLLLRSPHKVHSNQEPSSSEGKWVVAAGLGPIMLLLYTLIITHKMTKTGHGWCYYICGGKKWCNIQRQSYNISFLQGRPKDIKSGLFTLMKTFIFLFILVISCSRSAPLWKAGQFHTAPWGNTLWNFLNPEEKYYETKTDTFTLNWTLRKLMVIQRLIHWG